MKLNTKKFLSVLLSVLMLFTVVIPAVSAASAGDGSIELETTPIDPSTLQIPKLGEVAEDVKDASKLEAQPFLDDEIVRVSIFLNDKATLESGFSVQNVGGNASAISYRDSLKAKQRSVQAGIESVLGKTLDVKWNLTLAVNAISANVRYGDIQKIEAVAGVNRVEFENRYEAPTPVAQNDVADPNTSGSSYTVGARQAWTDGYTGAGSRIAVIDTGTEDEHQSFNADAFNYALQEDAANAGKSVSDYNLLTTTEISNKRSQLNKSSINVNSVYLNAKIPFAYNYIDNNYNTDHSNDSEGEHGSHVAGIATANRYLKSGSSYVDAANQVNAVGMAPDAQLLVMKVFGAGGGAYDSDYFAAIEDAFVLGADSINLSLGSSSSGFSYDNTYQSTLEDFVNQKAVVTISAGNNYAWDEFLEKTDGVYADDVKLHTGGSPGSFVNSLGVAASENTISTGMPLIFNGNQTVIYTETESTGAAMSSAAGTYDYVYIDAPGNTAEYTAVNRVVALSGKVVIVNRGELNFSVKGNNLKSYNPKALIVANNQAGSISMALDDYTGTFPMVSITQADADTIKANSTSGTTGSYTYYTGRVQITNQTVSLENGIGTENTNFSSWGVPGSLLLKPEITAPGGSIWSVNGMTKNSYENMSGTSMAAPHMAGLSAVLAQYVRENDIVNKTGRTQRQIIQSLLMSTAVPMKAADGSYQPVIEQGAGLANVYNATKAQSYIWMGADATISHADGKVKAEIGQNASRDGKYSYSFSINNFSSEAKTYTLSTDLFTQAVSGAYLAYNTVALDGTVTYSTGSSVTVPAGGSADVTVTIQLSDAQRADFDANRKTVYVEGYTYVQANGDVKHSIPIMGVYGSWTDSSMFDAIDYEDTVYGTAKAASYMGNEANYFTVRYNGDTAVKFTGNPYTTEASFPIDRLALNGSSILASATYTLIRNAATTIPAAIKEDGTVLSSGTASSYTYAPYYSASQGAWQSTAAKSTTMNISTAAFASKLTNGDKFTAGLFAIPEYYAWKLNPSTTVGTVTAADIGTLVKNGDLGEGALMGYTFTYDDKAPELLPVTKNADGTITVEAQDDHYIAYMAMMNIGGNTAYEGIVPVQSSEGQLVTYTFNPANYNTGAGVVIFVADYAGNETAAVVRISEGKLYREKTVYMLTNTASANNEYMIVTSNVAGSAYAMDATATDAYVSNVGVTIINDSNGTYINAEGLSDTSIWTSSSGIKFYNKSNGGGLGYYQGNDNETLVNWSTANYADSFTYSNYRLSERINSRTYYVRWYNNNFVISRTNSNMYLYVKTTIQEEYDPDAVESVTVTPTVATLIPAAGITDVDLSVKVMPITALDRSVIWTSSDENIATVDENGHVAAVGLGTCQIRATSVQDPDKYGQCVVSVVDSTPMNASVNAQITLNTGFSADVDMDGDTDMDDVQAILGKVTGEYSGAFDADAADLDADGAISSRDAYILLDKLENDEGGAEPQFASINLNDMSTTKLADTDVSLVAGGRGGSTFYGLDADGVFHEYDASTYAEDEDASFQMNMTVAPMDAANLPTFTVTSSGTTYTFDYDYVGVTETGYVTFPTADGNVSYFDFSDVATFVAITFIGYSNDTANNRTLFYFYAMGADGNMYILAPYGTVSSGTQGLSAQYGTIGKINTLNIGSDLWAYSMTSARDPEGNSDTSDDSVFIADNTTKAIYYIDFSEEQDEYDAVYVGRLPDCANISSLHDELFDTVDSLSSAEAAALNALITNELPAEKSGTVAALEKIEAPKSAASVQGIAPNAASAGDTAADGTVKVTLTEAEAANNGKIIVTYNKDELTYVSAESSAAHYSVNAEEGQITFAYATLDAIAADAAIAELTFTAKSCEDTKVTAVTNELNDNLALDAMTEPAITGLDHDWGDWNVTTPATCVAEGEEKRTCARCGEEETRTIAVDSENHTGNVEEKEEDIVPATCVEDGSYNLVTYCADCGEKLGSEAKTLDIDPENHTGNTREESENVVNANCVTAGAYDLVTYCADCGVVLSSEHVDGAIDPNTHTGNVETKEEDVVPATCVEDGSYNLVTYCADCGEKLSSEAKTLAIDPENHTGNIEEKEEDIIPATCVEDGSYNLVTYCADCGAVLNTEAKTLAIDPANHTGNTEEKEEDVVPATCVEEGSYNLVTYCTDCGAVLGSEAKTLDIDPENHTGNTREESENVVNANCVTAGAYDLVTYCADCGVVLSSEHVDGAIDPNTHTGNVETKEEDVVPATCAAEGSYNLVTYCADCGAVLNTEAKTLAIDPENHTGNVEEKEEDIIPATCVEEGSYNLVTYCADCGEKLSSEAKTLAIDPANHTGNVENKEEDVVPATCVEEGSYNLVTYCADCGAKLGSEAKTLDIDPENHTGNTEEKEEDVVPATCVAEGSYNLVTYCADCGAELNRVSITTDPIGHAYQITYTWSEDNATVTATAVCANDETHVVTETAETSYEEVTPATSEAEGEGRYTVSFDSDLFEDQEKTVVLPKLDADYEFVGFIWNDDNTADAIVRDNNNGGKETRLSATVTSETVAARCVEDGSVVYTASITVNGETYTESKTVVLPATGHRWGAPSFTWNADFTAATATFVCRFDASHVETRTATVKTDTTAPTCTGEGKVVFTATVTGPDGKTYTAAHTEVIEALGHDYDENGVCQRCGDGGDCPWCGEHHDRKTLSGWWTELLHHILYIINRIFFWWSCIAK